MADIHGRCEERFAKGVRAALARNLDSGEELGASLVLDIDGDIVIDMWGRLLRTRGGPDGARERRAHHHQRLVRAAER